jgi:hypothetical protein
MSKAKEPKPMTHKQMVKRMANWMKYNQCACVVISELHTMGGTEQPDVIGWKSCGSSVLVECKTSRADFFADDKKWFRRESTLGMGGLRFVAVPKGLVKKEEVPENWGLLEVDDRCVRVTVKAQLQECSKWAECKLLVSSIRRLQLSTAVYVVQDECANQEPVVDGEIQ